MRFQDWAARANARELIDALLDEIGYRSWVEGQSDSEEIGERRWRNICELVDWIDRVVAASGPDCDLAEAVRRLVLTDMLDRRNEQSEEQNAVNLMTLHAAKGLEFDNVFIVGLADDMLPHANSSAGSGVEEERRLFYVGITRARNNLTLSYPCARRRYGEVMDCSPSRFLDELPRDELDWQAEAGDDTAQDREVGRSRLAGLRAMLSN
jgi:ATP-dependent DNA helicase Rep